MKSTKQVTGINPEMLRWARERTGSSISEIALVFKKSVEEIEQWETGVTAPTYPQLEKLAYQLYKRPLALFFFPEPPQESEPKQEFRTLPEFEIENLSRHTRFALRQAEAMQLALRELNDEINPSPKKIFRDIKVNVDSLAIDIAIQVRSYLGVNLKEQTGWKDNDDALKHWRSLIQDVGIFVFKDSLEQKDISGFCLIDLEFPVIYLNNSTTKTRQSFTLFHELAHILFKTSGMTKQNDYFIERLAGDARKIETFANQFAGECLVPSNDFNQRLKPPPFDDLYIKNIADSYHVSREVVLRKLLDRKYITQAYYRNKVEEWNKAFEERRKTRQSGGDYYATQATYLGDKFLQLAFSKYYQGHYGVDQLADYLGIKVHSITGLEHFLIRGAVS